MCGQGIGDYTPETLYLNGDSCTALRRGSDGMLYVPSSFMLTAQLHLGAAFSIDKSIAEWAGMTNTTDTISQWIEADGEKITTYNPAMRDSPVKLTRDANFITIKIFYNLINAPDTIGNVVIWQAVEAGFAKWAKNGALYYKNPGYDSFGCYDGVQVQVYSIGRSRGNNVDITFEETSGYDAMTTYGGLSPWSVGSRKVISVTDKLLNPTYADEDYLSELIAHETGHLLGIGDAYSVEVPIAGSTKIQRQPAAPVTRHEVPEYAIMREIRNGIVMANDIEMILEAWKTNQFQEFIDVWYLYMKKSNVIKSY